MAKDTIPAADLHVRINGYRPHEVVRLTNGTLRSTKASLLHAALKQLQQKHPRLRPDDLAWGPGGILVYKIGNVRIDGVPPVIDSANEKEERRKCRSSSRKAA